MISHGNSVYMLIFVAGNSVYLRYILTMENSILLLTRFGHAVMNTYGL